MRQSTEFSQKRIQTFILAKIDEWSSLLEYRLETRVASLTRQIEAIPTAMLKNEIDAFPRRNM